MLVFRDTREARDKFLEATLSRIFADRFQRGVHIYVAPLEIDLRAGACTWPWIVSCNENFIAALGDVQSKPSNLFPDRSFRNVETSSTKAVIYNVDDRRFSSLSLACDDV